MLNRKKRITTAKGKLGMSGTSKRRMFDGKCVNTIVLTSPILEANRDAMSAEIPASRFAMKKIAPKVAGFTPNLRKNQ
jgi:hypothetical protein